MAEKLLDRVRGAIRARGYSIRTERAYVGWVVRYVRYHKMTHPEEMGARAVNRFLTHLAVDLNVAANTQNQALSALLFLYKHVLRMPLEPLGAIRAKKPQKLPVVLDRHEVRNVLFELRGVHKLIGAMLYGSGLRLMECLRLRVKDLDFEYQCIHLHNAKGRKDRIVAFPSALHPSTQVHLESVKMLHQADVRAGLGAVYLPHALERKSNNNLGMPRLRLRNLYTCPEARRACGTQSAGRYLSRDQSGFGIQCRVGSAK